MDSQDNQTQAQPSSPEPNTVSNESPVQTVDVPKKPASDLKKWLVIAGVLALIGGLGIGAWVMNKDDKLLDSATDDDTTSEINSFDECVLAGYPVMESFPEQCSVPGGETFVSDVATDEEVAEAVCADGYSEFADEEFGARFCYPEEWGTATIEDAKVGPDDTGHREMIRFSANDKFAAGGMSEDWSTTVGRGVGCQEPNNVTAELGSYNIDWNNIEGTGMDVSYAQRSLESSAGGYDITETVSNMLENGVCTQAHKVIDGSRYRVFYMAFVNEFGSGILTPSAHIDNPNILFTEIERTQLDLLLASAEAF